MKYLSDIIKEKQSALFKELGVFFAFNDSQFEEGKDPKLKAKDYTTIGGGCVLPKIHVEDFLKRHASIVEDGIAEDIALHGISAVIDRELGNHEAWYTGDISSTLEALDGYDVTEDQVLERYRAKYYNPVTNMNEPYAEPAIDRG